MQHPLEEVLKGELNVEEVIVPCVRYRFRFQVTASILFPPYAGSTIRGAFGRALRRTSCMTHQAECKECPLYRTCPYTQVFETPPPLESSLQKFSQIPNSYVIEPPQWGRHVYEVGDLLQFDVVLFGQSVKFLPLIIYAMKKAFLHDVGHGKALLTDVFFVDGESEERIYGLDVSEVAQHPETSVIPVPTQSDITIRIETPMRLQNNGLPLGPELITSRVFFTTLLRRISLLMDFQCGIPLPLDFKSIAMQAEHIDFVKDLGWKDWERYSSRQSQKMKLGGVVGSMHFADLPQIFRTLLAVGQLTHVGKNATFGLGKIRIEDER